MSAVLEHRPLAKLDALQAHADEFTGMRRDIHRHPELGFQEFRTSELVAERLTQWGYSVTRGLGGTGVVGQLQRGTGAKRLGLRADMDALPIVEATGLAHASCHTGVMHACGHDGHTAMLLAAAQHLAEHGDFSGTLNLIFQPAEEGLGGAVKMMEDGLFARFPCDAIFGMHNMPGYPAGHLALRQTQGTIRTDAPNWQPWLVFFSRSLAEQVRRLEKKVEREKLVLASLPELSLQIIEMVRERGRSTIGEVALVSGANRNTIKHHLRNLVERGHLNQQGSGRGVWYELR